MMRRKNATRRAHALSSVSIRSEEIAATDMALSRDWSRDGVSDMRIIVHDRERAFLAATHGPSARQNQSGRWRPPVREGLRQVKATGGNPLPGGGDAGHTRG